MIDAGIRPELALRHQKTRNSYMFRSGMSTGRWVFRYNEFETKDAPLGSIQRVLRVGTQHAFHKASVKESCWKSPRCRQDGMTTRWNNAWLAGKYAFRGLWLLRAGSQLFSCRQAYARVRCRTISPSTV